MSRPKKAPEVAKLADELAQVNQPSEVAPVGEPVTTDTAEVILAVTNPALEVEAENVEAHQSTSAMQDLDEIDAILAENAALKAQIVQLQAEKTEHDAQPEEVSPEEAALYWEGIIHPDYRLKTIYLPINNAPSKANGYDPAYGESYIYTPITAMHQPPGYAHHRRDIFNVRVDQRVVVPAFVAKQLGTRVDAQDYFGE